MKDLRCERNLGNYNDTFVVTVKKRTVPGASGPHPTIYIIYINCSPSLVIWWCDSIKCTVTANKWYSSNLPQGGLELPCILAMYIYAIGL